MSLPKFDRLLFVLLTLLSCLTLVVTLVVIGVLFKETFLFFLEVAPTDFLFGTKWTPLLEPKSFGVLPLVSGTLSIVTGAMFFALPLGLMVAICLSEQLSSKMRSFVKPVLEILAGVPTVVYGYFALTFITPFLKAINEDVEVFNLLSASIVVGLMLLPMMASLCDDSFQSICPRLKEGAYALGARNFEVIIGILIPASITRIGAATLLAISRAIGETMAVTLAAGATAQLLPHPFQSIQTMTAYIVQVSLGDIPQGGVEYLSCFAVAALLFLMTFVINVVGIRLIFKETKA